ncbi:MAG: FAD:protein FMN transferase [Rhodobacteraceae bacterium]|nr:FAD:protein FMN transferase [Paracoccaceae bacterium]
MATRRRILKILAGGALASVAGFAAGASPTLARWQGVVLGAEADIRLDHPDAARLLERAVQEIYRLERLFSLYRPDSELVRLNRDGRLGAPSFEMLELLSLSGAVHFRTQGAFDPTVQSLWATYARAASAGQRPDAAMLKAALARTGWQYVRVATAEISFARPGVMLTLNGIAQGYIADKVSALLRGEGVENVLINTGEIMAMGQTPAGEGWPVRLQGQARALSNFAVATSAPRGSLIGADSSLGHILDPRTGLPGGVWREVSVISKSAAIADGLSTGFCLMDESRIAAAKGADEVLLRA